MRLIFISLFSLAMLQSFAQVIPMPPGLNFGDNFKEVEAKMKGKGKFMASEADPVKYDGGIKVVWLKYEALDFYEYKGDLSLKFIYGKLVSFELMCKKKIPDYSSIITHLKKDLGLESINKSTADKLYYIWQSDKTEITFIGFPNPSLSSNG